ncbi:MAG: hypothetical protein H0U92_11210 [Actinobacteria bacterium]|nr:hypothetical protein [Actinomycetota bacterium]
MVRHLVSLKLALLRGGLKRGGRRSALALIASLLFAFGLGALTFLALVALRTTTDATSSDVAAVVFFVLLLGWVVAPLLALASDNTLDIDRLSAFPLTGRQLMPGLLLSAAVGPGGVFTALVLLGVFVGTAPMGLGAIPVAVVVALEFLLCMALSRLVSTTLSAATSKRRWRDVALFVGPLLALVINGGLQLLNGRFTDESGRFSTDPQSDFVIVTRRIARWLPTGWGAQAIHGAQTKSFVAPALGLLATAGLIAGVVALWWRAIQAATTNPATGGRSKRAVRTALFPWAVVGLPKNALGGIVAKELRYSWREPRRRAALLGLLTPALFPLLRLGDASTAGPRLCLLAALPMLTAGANPNLFGFDGDRFWADVVAAVPTRTELLARTLARALITVPLGLLLLAALVAFTRSPSGALPAIGLMAAVLGVASGYSAIASVRAPFPMPDVGRGNIFGSGGSGGGSAGGLASLAVVFGTMLTVSPLVVATLVVSVDTAQAVVFPLGLLVGVGGWLLCLRIAIPRQSGTEADLLAKLTRI